MLSQVWCGHVTQKIQADLGREVAECCRQTERQCVRLCFPMGQTVSGFPVEPTRWPVANSPSQKAGNVCSENRTQSPTQRTRDVLTTCVAKERPQRPPPEPQLQGPGALGPGGLPSAPIRGGREVARVLTFCPIALQACAWTRWGHAALGRGCPKDHVRADLPAAPQHHLSGGARPGPGQVRAVGG